MSDDKGVIYFVSGSQYHLDECLHSLRSLRRYHPHMPVTLFTTLPLSSAQKKLFNKVIHMVNTGSPFKLKVKAISSSPYERTLYLDSDTEIKSSLIEIWEFLETFDMAVARENELQWDSPNLEFVDYRSPFFNTGVIAFKKTKKITLFLQDWLSVMDSKPDQELNQRIGDQNFFNDLLNSSHMCLLPSILELPNKIYNVRSWAYEQLSPYERSKMVKIRHAHDLHWDLIKKVKYKISTYKKKR
jgi:hypothetical protein